MNLAVIPLKLIDSGWSHFLSLLTQKSLTNLFRQIFIHPQMHRVVIFTQVVISITVLQQTLFCTLNVLFLLLCLLFRGLCSFLICFHRFTYREWCICFWELACQGQNCCWWKLKVWAVSHCSWQWREQDLPILRGLSILYCYSSAFWGVTGW